MQQPSYNKFLSTKKNLKNNPTYYTILEKEQFDKLNYDSCPRCGIYIEKIGGCGNMQCICGKEFHYNGIISKPYRRILNQYRRILNQYRKIPRSIRSSLEKLYIFILIFLYVFSLVYLTYTITNQKYKSPTILNYVECFFNVKLGPLIKINII